MWHDLQNMFLSPKKQEFPDGPVVRTYPFTAVDQGLIHSQGTKISQAVQ